LFLVNSGAEQQDWFKSLYFRTWCVGSVIAVTYMPIVTIFTRANPLKVRLQPSLQFQTRLTASADRARHIRFWLEAWEVCRWPFGLFLFCEYEYHPREIHSL